MREILFRGKDIDSGLWCYGDMAHDREGNPYIRFWAHNGYLVKGVEPETVGQFTGFTDKNNKRIFEGDILNGFVYPFFNLEKNFHNYFAEVIWFDECGAFGLYTYKNPLSKVRGISAGNSDYMEEFDSDQWEVIGNIFDNPELLEVEK